MGKKPLPNPVDQHIFLTMPQRPRLHTCLRLVDATPADDMPPGRGKGRGRPHRNATVATVRKLVETTPLTYPEIAARAGVTSATVCRWTRDAGWKRHLFAPRALDTVPRERAGARLKLRTLAARLLTLTDSAVRTLEETQGVDVRKLGEAVALYRMAKLATMPRKRGRYRAPPRREWDPDVERPDQRDLDKAALRPGMPRGLRVCAELQAAGVDLDYAPEEAVVDYIKSAAYEEPALRPRRKRRKKRESPWTP